MTQKKKKDEINTEIKLNENHSFFSLDNFLFQCLVIFVLPIIFYGNTLLNGFALDDGLVWTDNKFVKNGFSGIFDILFHDSFYGTIGNNYNLAGGRWRPLSLITFAIENQLWGQTPWISHLINTVLYACTGMLLLRLIRNYFLPHKPLAAFAAVLLFMIHPVHTEAITNIKSRDEILSLLFLLITLIISLNVASGNKKPAVLIAGGLSFFIALLSKENGLMFLFIIPLTLYFFSKLPVKQIIIQSLPYFLIVGIYIALRVSIVGFSNEKVTELMDNPYLLATESQRFATIFFVFLLYFKLLFFPHPLSYDYSYNQIPYRDFSDSVVIFSIVLHSALLLYCITQLKKKNVLAWCVLFYFASMFIVSNIMFNIGAPLAERFLYQSSIAFCIAVVVLTEKIFSRVQLKVAMQKNIALALLFAISIPAAWKTITRNEVWRTGPNLGMTDVNTSTNSARANSNAASNYISLIDTCTDEQRKKAYLEKAIAYCETSDKIYPDFYTNWMLLGFAYSRLDNEDKAVWAWKHALKIFPSSDYVKTNMNAIAQKYFEIGEGNGTAKNFSQSIFWFKKAINIDSANAEYWYNLGGAYFMNHQTDSAAISFEAALQINPSHTQAKQGLEAAQKQK